MSRCKLARFALLAAVLMAGCERYPGGGDIRIRRDMVDQPSLRPHESPLPLPEGSIPVTGWEPARTPAEAERLVNPVPAGEASLAKGKRLYEVYCALCHGASGVGDGRIAKKLGKVADLTEDNYVRATDGFLYHVIRYGSGIMPPYSENVSPAERWHVINYVRKLQRQ